MEEVCELARLADAALSGEPSGGATSVDVALAEAHEIAPLLHIAFTATGRTDAGLAALFEDNVRRQAEMRSILHDVAALSAAQDFAWLAIGGQPQAAQLYPDAGWRAASRIDLLIREGETDAVIGSLGTAGWSESHGPGAPWPRPAARSTMLADAAGRRITLHERLLFTPGPIDMFLIADGAYRPRQSCDPEDIPAPAIGAPMALNILLRGNAWRWSKLKWLLDLSAVLRGLDAESQTRLIESIERTRTEPVAIASLLTCRTVLDHGLPAMIGQWLDDRQVTSEIATRQALYRDALRQRTSSPAGPSPETTEPRPVSRLASALRARFATPARKAGQYQRAADTMRDRYPLAFRFAHDLLGDDPARRILSFGCSTGEEVFTLRRYFPKATIRGIEVDAARIRTCRRRSRETGASGISFECAATATGEPPESYDAIFCMAVFRDPALDAPATRSTAGYIGFDDFERGVADLVRCLKPGGLIFVEHANFRVSDSSSASALEPVLHADPPRSANRPGLYARDGCRIDGAEDLALGYRKRPATGCAE